MELENVKKQELREKITTIRTFPSYAKWMKENNVSPSKIFNEAVKELMEKEK